jgi:hypothetical protein
MYLVNNIAITLVEKNTILRFKDNEIDEKLLDKIKRYIYDEELVRLRLSREDDYNDVSMTVFADKNIFHFGIVDMLEDINYYYDNGSNDNSNVDISGHLFMKKMTCSSKKIVIKAILFFMEYASKDDSLTWLVEET